MQKGGQQLGGVQSGKPALKSPPAPSTLSFLWSMAVMVASTVIVVAAFRNTLTW